MIDTISKLKKKLDSVFSLFVRNKYAIRKKYARSGSVACFTCGAVKPVSEMQNGHYVSRVYLATRFDEENCRPQCIGCNIFKNGNLDEFAIRLEREKKGTLECLNQKKYKQVKYSTVWYRDTIEHYKKELQNLLDKL